MAKFTQSNSDNFLIWQKVNGILPLSRLQARGIPACLEGYNIEDLTLAQSLDVSGSYTSIFWADDGLDFYYLIGTSVERLYQKSVSTPFDISTVTATQFEAIAEDGTPSDLWFKSDGTKVYIAGSSNDTIYQYSLGTAWDISTISYESKSLDCSSQSTAIKGVAVTDTNVYVGAGSKILQYSITDGDLSTGSFVDEVAVPEETAITAVFYRSDEKLYYCGTSSDKVYELSIAEGNVARGVVTLNNSVLSDSPNPGGLFLDEGGFTLWVMDSAGVLSEYYVGCP